MRTVPVFCGKDCGGGCCPLLADIDGERAVRVYNNPAAGNYLKGCPRGFGLPLEQHAPDRILTPLVRSGPRGSGQFRQATWEEALSLTAAGLERAREQGGGPQAVLNLGSAGSLGALHNTSALLGRFLALFGGCTVTTNNYSNGAARTVLPYLLGPDWLASGWDASTIRFAEMIILWGANALEARLGAEIPQWLARARREGKTIVVIDPRRSATARQVATWHIACRPGADAALMLAVLHVLFSENLADRDFARARSVGLDELERNVLGLDGAPARSPAWAAPICGVPEEEIIRFARAYATAKPAMLLPGYSIQRVDAGEETYRLTVALQLATGNFGVLGGSTGSLNNRLPAPRMGQIPVPPVPERPGVPVLRWPDAVLEGRAGGYPSDIRAIYNLGGNYINQGGDTHKSMAAFAKVDFAVTHELFLTPTARWCDVVFPAAGPLEKEDIAAPWLGNFLAYKPQALAPRGQARSDYEILWMLAERMGFGEAFSEGRSAAEWVQRFMDQSEVSDQEAFRRTGVYFGREQDRVGLAEFSADPAGHPLGTPSGRVEIASRPYHADTGGPVLPGWQAPERDERYPLLLITPKSGARTHSQGASIPEIQARAKHALEMHPADAAARGIADGQTVRAFNANGVTQAPARVTDEIMAGVVSLPEGVWVELGADGVDIAGSANLLTNTRGTQAGAANIMHGIPVQVEKV